MDKVRKRSVWTKQKAKNFLTQKKIASTSLDSVFSFKFNQKSQNMPNPPPPCQKKKKLANGP